MGTQRHLFQGLLPGLGHTLNGECGVLQDGSLDVAGMGPAQDAQVQESTRFQTC